MAKAANIARESIANAVFYLIKTGCQWRFLPQEYPPWKTVYSFYIRAKQKDIWEKMMISLVEKSRRNNGRKINPSYSLIDSQSVKTTDKAEGCGIDGGKKLKDVNAILSQIHRVIFCM